MSGRNDQLTGRGGGFSHHDTSTIRRMDNLFGNLACANDTVLDDGGDGSSTTALPFPAMRDVWSFLAYPPIPQWFVLPLSPDRMTMDHDLSRVEPDDRNAFYHMFLPSRSYLKGQKYFRHLIIPLFHRVETEHGTVFLWSVLYYDRDANLVSWYASSRWHRAAFMADVVGFVEQFPGPGLVESQIASRNHHHRNHRNHRNRRRTPLMAVIHMDLGKADFRAYSLRRDNPNVFPRDMKDFAGTSFWATVHAVRHLMVRGTPGSDVPPFKGGPGEDTRLAKALMWLGINDFFGYLTEAQEQPTRGGATTTTTTMTMNDSRGREPTPAEEDRRRRWVEDALVIVWRELDYRYWSYIEQDPCSAMEMPLIMAPAGGGCSGAPADKKRKSVPRMEERPLKRMRVVEDPSFVGGAVEAESSDEAKESDGEEWVELEVESEDERWKFVVDRDFPLPTIEGYDPSDDDEWCD